MNFAVNPLSHISYVQMKGSSDAYWGATFGLGSLPTLKLRFATEIHTRVSSYEQSGPTSNDHHGIRLGAL